MNKPHFFYSFAGPGHFTFHIQSDAWTGWIFVSNVTAYTLVDGIPKQNTYYRCDFTKSQLTNPINVWEISKEKACDYAHEINKCLKDSDRPEFFRIMALAGIPDYFQFSTTLTWVDEIKRYEWIYRKPDGNPLELK